MFPREEFTVGPVSYKKPQTQRGLWGLRRPRAPGVFLLVFTCGCLRSEAGALCSKASRCSSARAVTHGQSLRPFEQRGSLELGERASEVPLQMPAQKAASPGEAEPRGWLQTSSECGDGRSLPDRFPHEEPKGSRWQPRPSRAGSSHIPPAARAGRRAVEEGREELVWRGAGWRHVELQLDENSSRAAPTQRQSWAVVLHEGKSHPWSQQSCCPKRSPWVLTACLKHGVL